ncbi:MAG: type II 3-dehydroquinate dehydratase [Balneolaceae bacterium]
MTIVVLNGPNLNLLGHRDPGHYGSETLADIEKMVRQAYPSIDMEWVQSNHEGELIDRIHKIREEEVDGVVANWGAYTHTSIALRDALELLEIPVVEVHLSNLHRRESFRHTSWTAAASLGIIAGFGGDSYRLGVEAVRLKLRNS